MVQQPLAMGWVTSWDDGEGRWGQPAAKETVDLLFVVNMVC
jgi:hypothetical protein